MEVLQDEALVGLHAALTPTWSETAIFADYVLPMGHAGERHDIQSQETQSRPLGELPPAGAARGARADGGDVPLHLRGQPGRGVGGGRVLDRAVAGASIPTARSASAAGSSRPTGRARSSRSTSTTAGSSRTRCPGCPRRPPAEGLTPLEYMRRYGAFLIEGTSTTHERRSVPATPTPMPHGVVRRGQGSG